MRLSNLRVNGVGAIAVLELGVCPTTKRGDRCQRSAAEIDVDLAGHTTILVVRSFAQVCHNVAIFSSRDRRPHGRRQCRRAGAHEGSTGAGVLGLGVIRDQIDLHVAVWREFEFAAHTRAVVAVDGFIAKNVFDVAVIFAGEHRDRAAR